MIEPKAGDLMGWGSGIDAGSIIISKMLGGDDIVARLDYRQNGAFSSYLEETAVSEDDEMVIERPEP